MLKRYFAKDIVGGTTILFVDEMGKAAYINDTAFDQELTLEVAKNGDYSNFDGCETAEEAAENYYTGENIMDFNENDWDELIEF